MTKVEIIALAERWQAKADRAMERYQEDSQSRRIYGEGGRARRWQHGKAPAQSRPAC